MTSDCSSVDAVRTALLERRVEFMALVERRCGGQLDAEEVVQAAYARAIEHAGQLRDPCRATAWVARVVRNVLMDELRKRRVFMTPADELELASLEEGEIDCWCVLVQAGLLKAEYSQILRRVIVDGLSLAQVALELQLSVNNATVRLHRAREALKVRMKAHCGTTSARSCSECGCEERGCCPRPQM